MALRACGKEIQSLLKWSMLAACTIGPGTVIVCAKSGTDYGLDLIWTLVVASLLAFILQEEAARLSMNNGKSLGEALRRRFASEIDSVPVAGYVAVIGVFIGNTAYEANCFVGAVAALFVLYDDILWFRILMSVVTGLATIAALLWGDVDQLGQLLGLIVMGMTVLFAVVAAQIPTTAESVGLGLIPSIPVGSSVTVLSMVATTCIPFNIFLAASMCETCTSIAQMKRGVAFASVMTMIISILIVVVGTGIDLEGDFTVEDLGQSIKDTVGEGAGVFFCVGLYAAAYSSAITCPLGIALTAKQVFLDGRGLTPEAQDNEASLAAAESGGVEVATQPGASSVYKVEPDSTLETALLPDTPRTLAYSEEDARITPKPAKHPWDTQGLYFRAVMIICVTVAVVVSSTVSSAQAVSVVFLAQVINGLLLPFLTVCMVLCVDDSSVNKYPPSMCTLVALLWCVMVTVFLAFHTIIEQVSDLGRLADIEKWDEDVNIIVAAVFAVVFTACMAGYMFWRRKKRGRRGSVQGIPQK